MLPDRGNLEQPSMNTFPVTRSIVPRLSGEVARMIRASIDPPRNGGSSVYQRKARMMLDEGEV